MNVEGWREISRPGAGAVNVHGVIVAAGSRVRLRPRATRDLMDRALEGRVAVVHRVEQDLGDDFSFAVTLEGDPARDLGPGAQIGHRFFFAPDEVEPLVDGEAGAPPVRVLVAGIGNVFLGDDGFGVRVVGELARRTTPDGVDVRDFGIRGMDLTYALGDRYDAAILVDATPRGEPPGTIWVIEPEIDTDAPVVLDTHGMDPVRVLRLARELGPVPARTLVVGCEPQTILDVETAEEPVTSLSAAVEAAVAPAVDLVESLIRELAGPSPPIRELAGPSPPTPQEEDET
jgi:hydrogenase maturation protease